MYACLSCRGQLCVLFWCCVCVWERASHVRQLPRCRSGADSRWRDVIGCLQGLQSSRFFPNLLWNGDRQNYAPALVKPSVRRVRRDLKHGQYTQTLSLFYIHKHQIVEPALDQMLFQLVFVCIHHLCVVFLRLHFRGDSVFLTKTDWSQIFPLRVESVFILDEWDSHSFRSVKSLELILISKSLVNLISSPNCHGSRLKQLKSKSFFIDIGTQKNYEKSVGRQCF